MDYFLVTQDKEYTNPPIIKNTFIEMSGKHKERNDYDKVEDNTVFLLKNKDDIEFIDWIDRQILLISKDVRDVIKFYMPYMKFKTILLQDMQRNSGTFYYIPCLKFESCISENSEWNFDKSRLNRIILKKAEMPKIPIFQLNDVRSRYIIARLDLVESLLRRNIEGIKFTKIEIE